MTLQVAICSLACHSPFRAWKPDLIHVTSPGALPVAAWLYSRLLRVPLVASFHTAVPTYLPKMGMGWLVSGGSSNTKSSSMNPAQRCPSESAPGS